MITLSRYGVQYNRNVAVISGLSTDQKPIDQIGGIQIQNGSRFIEMDTDKEYRFDAENKEWKEVI